MLGHLNINSKQKEQNKKKLGRNGSEKKPQSKLFSECPESVKNRLPLVSENSITLLIKSYF